MGSSTSTARTRRPARLRPLATLALVGLLAAGCSSGRAIRPATDDSGISTRVRTALSERPPGGGRRYQRHGQQRRGDAVGPRAVGGRARARRGRGPADLGRQRRPLRARGRTALINARRPVAPCPLPFLAPVTPCWSRLSCRGRRSGNGRGPAASRADPGAPAGAQALPPRPDPRSVAAPGTDANQGDELQDRGRRPAGGRAGEVRAGHEGQQLAAVGPQALLRSRGVRRRSPPDRGLLPGPRLSRREGHRLRRRPERHAGRHPTLGHGERGRSLASWSAWCSRASTRSRPMISSRFAVSCRCSRARWWTARRSLPRKRWRRAPCRIAGYPLALVSTEETPVPAKEVTLTLRASPGADALLRPGDGDRQRERG